MSKSIETQAKTIEAAIEEALAQLGATYDDVDVDILQEAGFLKKAKVKVTLKKGGHSSHPEPAKDLSEPTDKAVPVKESKETKQTQPVQKDSSLAQNDGSIPLKLEKTLTFTKKLIELLGSDAAVTHEITDKCFNINVNGGNVGEIIGKGGIVLGAIQTIISSIAIANAAGEQKRVYFNVEDYKERREETLKAMAVRKAEKVKATGRYIKLDPMSARDRAIIHSALDGIEGIRTYSTGSDPNRCLCIAPKNGD